MNSFNKCLGSLLGIIFLLGTVAAQESNDGLDNVRNFPLDGKQVDSYLISIDWQISQIQELTTRYTASRDKIQSEIAVFDQSIKESQDKIKTEFQNLDAEGQSKLVARAMEKLLDAKLELAALESTVDELNAQLTKNDGGKLQQLKEQEAQIEIETTKNRYELAVVEYEKTLKLAASGNVSQQQLSRAKTSSEIAGLELKAAETRASIEQERAKAQTAQQIADYRIKIRPIHARIATLTEFLDSVAESNKQMAKITSLRRAQELWMRDLELVASELFELGKKKLELDTLKNLIENKEKKSD